MQPQTGNSVGTAIYMAPGWALLTSAVFCPEVLSVEVMAGERYNCKLDVYSFGMVLWEIMAEKQPFFELKRIWDLRTLNLLFKHFLFFVK